MDLSKEFDTLNHDLLIVKLETYGFFKTTLIHIQKYLDNCSQRTNMKNNFIFLKDISANVSRGSILCTLLFNVHINDKFLFGDNACLSNYADDTTLYSTGKNHSTNRNIFNENFLRLKFS